MLVGLTIAGVGLYFLDRGGLQGSMDTVGSIFISYLL